MGFLRKSLVLLCISSMFFACTSCGGGGENSSTDTSTNSSVEKPPLESDEDTTTSEGALKTYNEFDLDAYLTPYWDTDVMYNETLLFVGANDEAPLMYAPTEIISVRNYGLNIEYQEDVDYVLENGKIKRTANSRIPYFAFDEYYLDRPDTVGIRVINDKADSPITGTKYLKHGEGDTFTQKQIAVTYRHAGVWSGTIPQGKTNKLQNVFTKLKNADDVTVVYYGDSITEGANASGTPQGNMVPPYMPKFDAMVNAYLEEKYGSYVFSFNTAVGGWNTSQGLSNVQTRVLDKNPDLLILGFGMNDFATPVAEYKSMIKSIIDQLHAQNPDANVILVGTTVPNYETDWYGNQELFVGALNELEATYDFVAVADMTTMHKDMFRAGKRFRDVTSNNVNHPNDFVIRAYAQVILKTLLGDEFTV